MIFNEINSFQIPSIKEQPNANYGDKAKTQAWYFGEMLKKERQKKHITQLELAEKIGKERSYISRVERGQTDLRLSSFLQIVNALNLSLSIN